MGNFRMIVLCVVLLCKESKSSQGISFLSNMVSKGYRNIFIKVLSKIDFDLPATILRLSLVSKGFYHQIQAELKAIVDLVNVDGINPKRSINSNDLLFLKCIKKSDDRILLKKDCKSIYHTYQRFEDPQSLQRVDRFIRRFFQVVNRKDNPCEREIAGSLARLFECTNYLIAYVPFI